MTGAKQQGRESERGDNTPAGSQVNGGEQLGRVPGRRRFLGGATATGFVAFTVFGRPAWANGCSLSAQMSGNTSAQMDSEPCGGEGLSPGFWKNHTLDWHSKFPPSMLFADAFAVGAFSGSTLYDVISLQASSDEDSSGDFFETSSSSGSSDEQTNRAKQQARYDKALRTLGMHAVAALQNAASTIRYDLTVSEVQASVREACNSHDPERMERTKNSLDRFNNQGGTLT
jgi:hypothetical protein